MSYLVFSTSLKPDSRSRLLARHAQGLLADAGEESELIDLQEVKLPMCDAGACYEDAEVQALQEKVKAADGILLATPVYNYTVSSSVKNLIELTDKSWRGKVVGFMCAAGGQASYMAIMNTANSHMLDFRCIIIPRFVYATEMHFRDDQVADEVIQQRIEELTGMLTKLSTALREE